MTFMEKAVLAAIKEHNAADESNDNYLTQFNKGIKLLSMGPDNKRGAHVDHWHNEYPGESQGDYTPVRVEDPGLRLAVKCKFKPANKYDNNVVLYEVILYSNGTIGIYFDGTEYAD